MLMRSTETAPPYDLDACVAFAKGEGKADTAKLGITGFCWGGRITWLYAAHNPGVKAGVAWYGRVVGDSTAMTPKHPVDLAKDLKAPVLGLYGGADTGIPNDTVDKMRAALKDGSAAAKKSEIVKVMNRWGNTTLVRIDKKVKEVGANPVKGEMGYTLYSVEK